jgi:hypothetical protein
MPSADNDDDQEIQLRRWLKCLRVDFPLCRPAIVLLRPAMSLKDEKGEVCGGFMRPSGKRFVIWLSRQPTWELLIEYLKEEWTHARLYPDYLTHDVRFDLEMGNINRKYRGYE